MEKISRTKVKRRDCTDNDSRGIDSGLPDSRFHTLVEPAKCYLSLALLILLGHVTDRRGNVFCLSLFSLRFFSLAPASYQLCFTSHSVSLVKNDTLKTEEVTFSMAFQKSPRRHRSLPPPHLHAPPTHTCTHSMLPVSRFYFCLC